MSIVASIQNVNKRLCVVSLV